MKPYETIQELLEAVKIHGPYVKRSFGRDDLEAMETLVEFAKERLNTE